MAANWKVFGPIVPTHLVEDSILALAEEWLSTYVNAVADTMGMAPGSIQYPASYQRSFDFENRSTLPLPTFVVVCSQVSGFERGAPEGEVGGWFDFEAGVAVDDQTEASARKISSVFAVALAVMLEQRRGLKGRSDDTIVQRMGVRFPAKDVRTVTLGYVKAQTFVNNIWQRNAMVPVAPGEFVEVPQQEGPATPWPERPTAQTVTVDVDAVQTVTPEAE
jgi:hypothetical protein